MARFSGGDSVVKHKPGSGWPCKAVTPRNEERLDQLIRANRRSVYGAEYRLQCVGNDGGNVGILIFQYYLQFVIACGICELSQILNYLHGFLGGTRWSSLLRHCATSPKVTGSIPDGRQ